MAFIPVANTAQVELRYLWDGQRCENVLYFTNDAPYTASDLSDLALAVFDWWQDNMRAAMPATLALNEVYCTDISSATGPVHSYAPTSGNVGTSAGISMPNNVALAITFRTGQRGRSGRGRNYIPGLTETNVTNNEVAAASVDYFQDAYALLMSGAFAGPGIWSVVSRYTGNAPRLIGQSLPVTSVAIVDAVVDSQRRRLPKRGQ